MSDSLDAAEVAFAQRLASGQPNIRDRAFERLSSWIRSSIEGGVKFERSDLLKIWKGLHYCMWMRDKPLLQEELSINICKISTSFASSVDQYLLFHETFWETIAREWYKLDKFRIDKFMMLCRDMFTAFLEWLSSDMKWSTKILRTALESWQPYLLNSTFQQHDGLKMHFASLYLDELDCAASEKPISKPVLTTRLLITPYIDLITTYDIAESFFKNIEAEIFQAILLQHSAQLQKQNERLKRAQRRARKRAAKKGVSEAVSSRSELPEAERAEVCSALRFNLKWIAKELETKYQAAPVFKPERREVIIELVEKFRKAASGVDVCIEYISDPSDLEESDFEEAVERYFEDKYADVKPEENSEGDIVAEPKKKVRKSAIQKRKQNLKQKRQRKRKLSSK